MRLTFSLSCPSMMPRSFVNHCPFRPLSPHQWTHGAIIPSLQPCIILHLLTLNRACHFRAQSHIFERTLWSSLLSLLVSPFSIILCNFEPALWSHYLHLTPSHPWTSFLKHWFQIRPSERETATALPPLEESGWIWSLVTDKAFSSIKPALVI